MADKKISQLTGATTPLAGSEVLPIVQGGSTVKVSVNNLTAGKAVTASTLALSGGAAFGGAALDNGVGRLIVDASGFSYAITAIGNDQSSARIRFKNSAVGGSDYAFIAGENNVGQTGATFFKIGTGTLLTLDDGSGNFKVNGGNVVVGTAAKGIDFSANTHAAGMTSELLNWYEEGTWTPVLSDGTNNATMEASTEGKYTRIGRVVYLNFTVYTSSLGSVTGDIRVTGLPFTANASTGPAAVYSSANQFLAITAGQYVSGRILGNSTYVELWLTDAAAGMTKMQGSEWSADGYANFAGFYIV